MESQAAVREIASTRPEPGSVREHLARVLESAQFSGSARLRGFLQYCVDSALEGSPGRLKEYDIAVSVFDRESGFDPRLDPIVRVQAVRLRGKLKEYYHESGSREQVRILIPKGGYMACFESVAKTPSLATDLAASPACPERVQRTKSGIDLRDAMRIALNAVLTPVSDIRNAKFAISAHRSAAVMDLRNLSGSGEPSWLPRALREMLTTELGQSSRIRMLPEEGLAPLRAELTLPDVGGFNRHTLERIGKSPGAELVLTGSYLAIGGRIRLDVHLQETRSGKTLALLSRMDDESNLLELVSIVGRGIRAKLGAEVSGN